jgi:hypothetical protein
MQPGGRSYRLRKLENAAAVNGSSPRFFRRTARREQQPPLEPGSSQAASLTAAITG